MRKIWTGFYLYLVLRAQSTDSKPRSGSATIFHNLQPAIECDKKMNIDEYLDHRCSRTPSQKQVSTQYPTNGLWLTNPKVVVVEIIWSFEISKGKIGNGTNFWKTHSKQNFKKIKQF